MSINNTLVPIVVERDPKGFERSYDIYSRLLKDFIVFVTGTVTMEMANTFIAQMLFLESENPDRDISVYINSPGGAAYAGFAMYDTMKHVKNPITTINVGLAASAGALILSAGDDGKRLALPGSFTLIHQALGGTEGQATDIDIYAKQIVRVRDRYAQAIATASGKDLDTVIKDIERDNWMDAKETKKYGLIDAIMDPKKKSKK